MKKTIYLFVFAIITISCDSLDSLLELNINNDLTENIAVSVSQTQGVAASFDLSETTDLNSGDLAEYRGKISAIKINKFTYKIKDFVGNNAGTIPSGTLKFDDVVVAELTDFNIFQAADAGTVFEITDANVLSSVENAFLNNNTTTVRLTGTVLSDAGTMDFNVEIFMNLNATIVD